MPDLTSRSRQSRDRRPGASGRFVDESGRVPPSQTAPSAKTLPGAREVGGPRTLSGTRGRAFDVAAGAHGERVRKGSEPSSDAAAGAAAKLKSRSKGAASPCCAIAPKGRADSSASVSGLEPTPASRSRRHQRFHGRQRRSAKRTMSNRAKFSASSSVSHAGLTMRGLRIALRRVGSSARWIPVGA